MTPRDDLPTTSYAILGVLSFRELSGYDIRKYADNSLAFFYWSPAPSQIYAELRRLRDRGLVEERPADDADGRNKRLYRITDEGHAALRDWVAAGGEPLVVKHTPMLRVWAGHNASTTELQAVLDEHEAVCHERLAELRYMQERAEVEEAWRYPAVVARWGVRHYEAELANLAEVRRELDELSRSPSSRRRPRSPRR